MNLNYGTLDADPAGNASTLAVFLHGFRRTNADMHDPIDAARAALTGGVDVYAPTLPYRRWWDWTGANRIVARLVADLDDIWSNKKHGYQRVIFVGYSMGGVLMRRLFLAGSPRPPDYAGAFAFRDDLPASVSRDEVAHGWAAKVERLVLIATWEKGWNISDRESWKYWLLLNFFGLVGHLTPPRLALAGTMFDMRRGAPFIVQTRLLWFAYRRWHNPAHGFAPLRQHAGKPARGADPLVVQIVATRDDFISPSDQVDNDVNGVIPPDDARARYFVLEMPETDHREAVTFPKSPTAPREAVRRKIFSAALTGTATAGTENGDAAAVAFDGHARDPALLEDVSLTPNDAVDDVIFVIHGIRDDGYWTHRIAKAVKETAAARPANESIRLIQSRTPTYGYFAMLPFVLPWIRRQKVEWFMDLYVSVKACFPNATMHYVGHSNGTYLAARALKDYAAARFGKVYFAGSVVRTDYDWPALTAAGRVERFHNARGATDWVVALLPKSIDYCSDLGGAGFDGFGPPTPDADTKAITQSKGYAWGGHSGAITEPHWGGIADFIVTGAKPPEPGALFAAKPHALLSAFSRLRLGIPVAVVIVLGALVVALAWMFRDGRPSARQPFDGVNWRYSLAFVAVFAVISALGKWSSSGPKAWLSTALLVIGGLAFGRWFSTSLLSELFHHGTLLAGFGLVLLLALIRFVLTRF